MSFSSGPPMLRNPETDMATRNERGNASRAAVEGGASGPLAQGREFVWTDADFSRVQALIYQRAGINLHEGKHAMVYSRLSRRLRETGHTSFHEYLGWLETHDGSEWQGFIYALN